MTPSPDHHDKLEQLIHRTLREQPPRRAPRSLEQRVLAELERRAALPWWRQSFAHWPVAIRGVFAIASVALAAALVWALGGFDLQQSIDTVTVSLGWIETVRGLADSFINFGAVVLRGISPVWLYGGVITIVALYAALVGLGTAAYRTLFANR